MTTLCSPPPKAVPAELLPPSQLVALVAGEDRGFLHIVDVSLASHQSPGRFEPLFHHWALGGEPA